MAADDNLTALLERATRYQLANLNTAMPARIVSYAYKKQKAVVQPLINRRWADGKIAPYPAISNVPVIFPRSGGASLTFPVKPGDTVLLICTSRSIETWKNSGGQVNQDDSRINDINDAVAIPGLLPFTTGSKAKNNNDVLLTYAGAEIEIIANSEIKMKSPQRVYIDAPETRMTGDLVVEKDIYDLNKEYGTFNRIRDIYNQHTHDENNDTTTDEPNEQLGLL